MKRFIAFLLILPLQVFSQDLDTSVINRCLKSIVLIEAYNSIGTQGRGTGFFVGKDKIVTNWHVVNRLASNLKFKRYGSKLWYEITDYYKIDTVLRNDFIILKSPYKSNDSIEANNLKPYLGQKVFAIGHPIGRYEFSISQPGIISGLDRPSVFGAEAIKGIQVTTNISQGNSGGPLLDFKGKALGVMTQTNPEGQNLNFAVPLTKLNLRTPDSPKSVRSFIDQDHKVLMEFNKSDMPLLSITGRNKNVISNNYLHIDSLLFCKIEYQSFSNLPINNARIVVNVKIRKDSVTVIAKLISNKPVLTSPEYELTRYLGYQDTLLLRDSVTLRFYEWDDETQIKIDKLNPTHSLSSIRWFKNIPDFNSVESPLLDFQTGYELFTKTGLFIGDIAPAYSWSDSDVMYDMDKNFNNHGTIYFSMAFSKGSVKQ